MFLLNCNDCANSTTHFSTSFVNALIIKQIFLFMPFPNHPIWSETLLKDFWK